MPITMKTDGTGELGEMIRNLGGKAFDAAAKALYDGAGVVADAYTTATNRIVTEKFHYLARPDLTGTMRYPSPEEKAALMGKAGLRSSVRTWTESTRGSDSAETPDTRL